MITDQKHSGFETVWKATVFLQAHTTTQIGLFWVLYTLAPNFRQKQHVFQGQITFDEVGKNCPILQAV